MKNIIYSFLLAFALFLTGCADAGKDQKETVVQRTAMTICSRVLIRDAIKAEDAKDYVKYAVRERKRNKILKDIDSTNDEALIASLTAKLEGTETDKLIKQLIEALEAKEDKALIRSLESKLEGLPALPKPEAVFPNDEVVLSFSIDNMSGANTLPVDNIRYLQAFQEFNMFEQESVEDFMSFPEV